VTPLGWWAISDKDNKLFVSCAPSEMNYFAGGRRCRTEAFSGLKCGGFFRNPIRTGSRSRALKLKAP
jgi:hypothetical protein